MCPPPAPTSTSAATSTKRWGSAARWRGASSEGMAAVPSCAVLLSPQHWVRPSWRTGALGLHQPIFRLHIRGYLLPRGLQARRTKGAFVRPIRGHPLLVR